MPRGLLDRGEPLTLCKPVRYPIVPKVVRVEIVLDSCPARSGFKRASHRLDSVPGLGVALAPNAVEHSIRRIAVVHSTPEPPTVLPVSPHQRCRHRDAPLLTCFRSADSQETPLQINIFPGQSQDFALAPTGRFGQ